MDLQQDNLESFFKKIIEVEEIDNSEIKSVKSSVSMFDYLKDVCYVKKGNIPEEKDFEMKAWNTFMILKYLSLDEGYLPLINIFNQYQATLTSKEMYKLLLIILPRNRAFLQYPKLKEGVFKEEEIEQLSIYYECPKKYIREYLEMGLLSKKDREAIIKKFGGKEDARGNNKGKK